MHMSCCRHRLGHAGVFLADIFGCSPIHAGPVALVQLMCRHATTMVFFEAGCNLKIGSLGVACRIGARISVVGGSFNAVLLLMLPRVVLDVICCHVGWLMLSVLGMCNFRP